MVGCALRDAWTSDCVSDLPQSWVWFRVAANWFIYLPEDALGCFGKEARVGLKIDARGLTND